MILNFKSFFELYDIENIDVSDIELKKENEGSYSYSFKQKLPNGNVENYKVKFQADETLPVPTRDGDYEYIRGRFYELTLYGPQGTQLTRVSGAVGNLIYQKMLLAIKKLISMEGVDGFSFTPAEIDMVVPYTKFIDKYLKPKGYVEINDGYFVIKSKVDELFEKIRQHTDPEEAEDFIDDIKHHLNRVDTGRKDLVQQVLAHRNTARAFRRNPELMEEKYLGKFLKQGRWAQYYILSVNPSESNPLLAICKFGPSFYVRQLVSEPNMTDMTKYEEDDFIRGMHKALEDGTLYAENKQQLELVKSKIPASLFTRLGLTPPSIEQGFRQSEI